NNFPLRCFWRLRSWALAAHPFQSFARNQKWSASVGSEYRVPLPQGESLKVGGVVIGGVVDQDVDTAKFASNIFHHRLDAGLVRDVAAQSEGAHAKAGK